MCKGAHKIVRSRKKERIGMIAQGRRSMREKERKKEGAQERGSTKKGRNLNGVQYNRIAIEKERNRKGAQYKMNIVVRNRVDLLLKFSPAFFRNFINF